MRKNLDALFVLLAVAGILVGQERFDLKVRTYFFAGFSGDTASLEKGMKMCEQTLADDPKNAEALVWHGGGLLFLAGQSFQKGDQQNGMTMWTRGLKEMDDAVAIAPESLGVQISRGAVLFASSRFLPSPEMSRPLVEKAIGDFEEVYKLQGPDLTKLGTHPHGELLIGLADGYNRLGNLEKARQWFEKIQKDMPGTAYAKSAATWLETKSLAPEQAGCLGCHNGK